MEIFNATNLLYIWGGFVKTIEISALSIFFSLIFGTVLALVKSYAPRPFRILVSAYIELFRCTPNLLWILWISKLRPENSSVFLDRMVPERLRRSVFFLRFFFRLKEKS